MRCLFCGEGHVDAMIVCEHNRCGPCHPYRACFDALHDAKTRAEMERDAAKAEAFNLRAEIGRLHLLKCPPPSPRRKVRRG